MRSPHCYPRARGDAQHLCRGPRCSELLDRDPAWKSTPVTAMICRDPQTVPDVPLPAELALLRAVRRRSGDPTDGVPLRDAAAAPILADTAIDDPPDNFADYLRSRPPGTPALHGPASTRPTPGCRSTGGSGSRP